MSRLLSIALLLQGCVAADAAAPIWTSGGGGASGSTITFDTFANLETAESSCVAGDLGFPTDSPLELRCESAGTWTRYYEGLPCPAPPSAGWTAYNSGSVAANSDGTRTLTLPAETLAGNGFRGEYRAVPSDPTSTPYEVAAVIVSSWIGKVTSNIGYVHLGHTDGTGLAALALGSANGVTAGRWSNSTTFVANDQIIVGVPTSPFRGKVGEDATNRTFFLGDPVGNYDELGSGNGRTVTFTADSNYWGGVSGDADITLSLTLMCWEENP